ncbi:DUF6340 family protein [Maribellus mangrovi]|uniref:DUF6340 family protein n=1 Tax=Maribellus mangrovi TaxID=3133146 RepID=UPI0030ECB674
MDRKVAPKLILEKQPANVVFRNNFKYKNNSEIKEKHEEVYKTGIDNFAKTLMSFTQPDDTMAVFTYDTTLVFNDTGALHGRSITKDEIISFCETFDADFLLSLDNLKFQFDSEVIREEDDDGAVSKTKEFYLICNYYLTLYGLDGTIKDQTSIEKSSYYTSRLTLSGLISINPNLAKTTKIIEKMAEEAAKEYIGMFYPSIERNVMQKLYDGKDFKETNALIKSGHYNEAIVLLKNMEITSKPKLAEKVNHNLNVAIEIKKNNIALD